MIRITLAFLMSLCLTSRGADFDDIIHHPEKFNGKRVTVVALGMIGGDRFYLYQPPEPQSLGDDHRVIYGLLLRVGPYYEAVLTKKRLKVTGVIDARYRGLVSTTACGLLIERVRPVGKVKEARLSPDLGSCADVKFSQILRDPKSYEHKCVCVTGFAHVSGDAFVIYESEKASGGRDPDSSTPDFKKGIFISQRESDTTNYDHYNNQWIKIKGVVDLKQRGFADYPAGIIVEEVRRSSP